MYKNKKAILSRKDWGGKEKKEITIVCYLDKSRTLFFLHFISLYVYGGHVDFV